MILAPDPRAPTAIELWLRESDTIKEPCSIKSIMHNATWPTRAGIMVEFVAKPMPITMAAGFLKNRAISVSRFK